MFHRFAKPTFAVLCLLSVLLTASPAWALNIVLNFDDGQSASPSFDSDGSMMQELFEYAEWHYQAIIETSHTITINYWYDNLNNNTLGVHNLVSQSGGRETEANIRIDTTTPGGATRNWFIDTTPFDHSEFEMQQTLWRDLSGTQRNDWYNFNNADDIPEHFEAGYEGAATSGGGASGATDMLTVVIHEVGHALGMSSANNATTSETTDGDYDFPTNFINGQTLAVETANNSGDDNQNIAHIENTDALMTPLIPGSTRRLPSATDIFAMAQAHNYTDIDLFRQDMWEPGDMNTDSNWAGDQTPDSADDVFIRFGTGIASLSAFMRFENLTIAEQADVDLNDQTLTVDSDTVLSRASDETNDTELIIDPGGQLNTNNLRLFGGELDLRGGTADVSNDLEIQFDEDTGNTQPGLVRGHGTVTVNGELKNETEIRATDDDQLLFRTDGGGVWDLDGGSGDGEINAVLGDIRFANGNLNDDYDGVMTVGNGTADRDIDFDIDWALGTGGVLNLNGGTDISTRAEIIGSGTTTIKGDVFADGWTEFDTDLVFASGADVNLNDADTRLELGATFTTITYEDATFTGTGLLKQDADATVAADRTVNINMDANFDFDGSDGRGTTLKDGGRMNITTTGLTDEHNGTITLEGDAVLNMDMSFELILDPPTTLSATSTDDGDSVESAVTIPAAWTLAGTMNLNSVAGTPNLVGNSRMNLAGTLNVNNGTSQILSPVTFQAGSTIDLPNGFDNLELQGGTIFDGGDFTGAGLVEVQNTATLRGTVSTEGTLDFEQTTNYNSGATINGAGLVRQNGTANVNADTTFNVNTLDMDGTSGDTIWNLTPGVTLDINSDVIESGTDGFDGTINNTSATLRVDTPNPWTLEGDLNFVDDGSNTPRLQGSQMIASSTADLDFAGGVAVASAPVQFETGSETVISTDGGARFFGPVTLLGGDFTGGGLTDLQINGPTTLNGTVNVTNLLHQEGDVTVTGDSTLAGTGTWDLDGVGSNTIWTLQADLTLNAAEIDNADGEFDGTMNIQPGSDLTAPNGWALGNNGTLNLNGDSIANRARIAGSTQTLANGSTTNVNRETQFDIQTTFDGTVNLPDSNDVLRLFDDSNVTSDATFAGNGTLTNVTNSRLTLQDSASVGVRVSNAGNLAVGNSPGSATVAGYSATSLGTLEIELGGTTAGTQHDQLTITGDTTLDGTLDVALINGFNPAALDTFDILQFAGPVSGDFADYNLPGLDPGLGWDTTAVPDAGTLEVFLFGDLNDDGNVDGLDIDPFVTLLTGGGFDPAGDINHDDTIDGLDIDPFVTLLTGSGDAALAAVPEPTTAALLGFTTLTLFRRRRHAPHA